MPISGVSGPLPQLPDWSKKSESKLVAQNQPKAADAKPAEQSQKPKKSKPPYENKLGKKPDLDNLEEFSDLRGINLERYELSEKFQNMNLMDKYDILIRCNFDTQTPWPPDDKMPLNFKLEDRKKIMERGMNPGLGTLELHGQGKDGSGVNMAVIDHPILKGHEKYKNKLKQCTEIGKKEGEVWKPLMHGPAVLSILGGVAPGANLYYWAASSGTDNYVASLIKGIRQIIDYNKYKPLADKIRIVSISSGCAYNGKNRAEWDSVVKDANESGLIIVSCSYEDDLTDDTFGVASCPLDKDKKNPKNYDLCYFLQDYVREIFEERGEKGVEEYFERLASRKKVYVPIDNRTFASHTGENNYQFGADGGASWGAPYFAGVMALGLQIDPDLKKKDIYNYLRETGTPFTKTVGKKEYDLGWIVNPKGFTDKVFLELGRKIDPELTMKDALKYIEETKMFVKNDNRLVINPKGFVDRVKLELKNRTNKTK